MAKASPGGGVECVLGVYVTSAALIPGTSSFSTSLVAAGPIREWQGAPAECQSLVEAWGGLFVPFLQELFRSKSVIHFIWGNGPPLDRCRVRQDGHAASWRQDASSNCSLAVWTTQPKGHALPKPDCCSTSPERAIPQKGLARDTWQKAEAHHETGQQVEPSQENTAQKGSVRVKGHIPSYTSGWPPCHEGVPNNLGQELQGRWL